MIRRVFNTISLAILTAFIISGCATTEVTSAWKDPTYIGQPRKVMVILVAKKSSNKRIFEDEFVLKLKAHGVDAFASYTVMTQKDQGDPAVIAAKLKEQDADAVLISRLVSKKTVKYEVPASVYYPPSSYGNCWDYLGYCSQAVFSPGYTAEDDYALMEINLYDARSGKLFWAVASETLLMGTDQELIKSYIGVMVDTMVQQKLLK
jgi:hypothetical protein